MPRNRRIAPTTLAHARQMRREPTHPEHRFWMQLRASRLNGLRFRQQHPIGTCIVDFYCAAAKLVIELDGVSHDQQTEYDAQRTQFLETKGLRVIRVTDDDVLRKMDNVLHVIACECGAEG